MVNQGSGDGGTDDQCLRQNGGDQGEPKVGGRGFPLLSWWVGVTYGFGDGVEG